MDKNATNIEVIQRFIKENLGITEEQAAKAQEIRFLNELLN